MSPELDIVEGIRRIKAKGGPDLIVWGSSTLTPVLLENELADEVFPVLLGTGKRLFSDGTPPRELALVATKTASSGIIISTCRPNGALRTGSVDDKGGAGVRAAGGLMVGPLTIQTSLATSAKSR
jgi:RibD domain-containing protein